MQPLGNVENWLCEVEQKMLQSIHWQVITIIGDLFFLKNVKFLCDANNSSNFKSINSMLGTNQLNVNFLIIFEMAYIKIQRFNNWYKVFFKNKIKIIYFVIIQMVIEQIMVEKLEWSVNNLNQMYAKVIIN